MSKKIYFKYTHAILAYCKKFDDLRQKFLRSKKGVVTMTFPHLYSVMAEFSSVERQIITVGGTQSLGYSKEKFNIMLGKYI